jgi:phosphatidylglycerophosphate synthase
MNQDILTLDTELDRKIHRPVARRLAQALSSTPITPNHLTLLTVPPAACSGFFYLTGRWAWSVAGLVFFYIWAVLDHADGELARITGRVSHFGRLLDDFCDHISSGLILAGMFFGLLPFWNVRDEHILMLLFIIGFTSQHVGHFFMTMLKRKVRQKAAEEEKISDCFYKGQKRLDFMSGRDLFYFLALLVTGAFFFHNTYWYSFTMGFLITGLFVMTATAFVACVKMRYNLRS